MLIIAYSTRLHCLIQQHVCIFIFIFTSCFCYLFYVMLSHFAQISQVRHFSLEVPDFWELLLPVLKLDQLHEYFMLNWLEMAAITACHLRHFILQSFDAYFTQGMHFYMRFEYYSNGSCNDKMRVKLYRLAVGQVNSPAVNQADDCKAHL